MDDVHRDGLTENENGDSRRRYLLTWVRGCRGVFHLGGNAEQSEALVYPRLRFGTIRVSFPTGRLT